MGSVGDRFAALKGLTLGRVVVPVETLATGNVGAQIIQIVGAAPSLVGMAVLIPPIRNRHVIVDSDEIDVRTGPKGIEMEIEIPVGLIAGVFRPVGCIADLAIGPKNGTHVLRKLHQCRDDRETVALAPDLRQ